jgi:hypothetical protein
MHQIAMMMVAKWQHDAEVIDAIVQSSGFNIIRSVVEGDLVSHNQLDTKLLAFSSLLIDTETTLQRDFCSQFTGPQLQ